MAGCDEPIASHVRANGRATKAAALPGVIAAATKAGVIKRRSLEQVLLNTTVHSSARPLQMTT